MELKFTDNICSSCLTDGWTLTDKAIRARLSTSLAVPVIFIKRRLDVARNAFAWMLYVPYHSWQPHADLA